MQDYNNEIQRNQTISQHQNISHTKDKPETFRTPNQYFDKTFYNVTSNSEIKLNMTQNRLDLLRASYSGDKTRINLPLHQHPQALAVLNEDKQRDIDLNEFNFIKKRNKTEASQLEVRELS